MKRKPIGILLILVLLLAACGTTATGTSEIRAAADTEIGSAEPRRLWRSRMIPSVTILQFAVTRQDRNQYDSLIDAFEAEHADVHIVTVSIEETLGVNRPRQRLARGCLPAAGLGCRRHRRARHPPGCAAGRPAGALAPF